MIRVRFNIHLTNKVLIITDWEDCSEVDLQRHNAMLANLKQLNAFITCFDGRFTSIHPEKIAYVVLEEEEYDEEGEEDLN